MTDRHARHLEHLLTMRAYLSGRRYFKASRALQFAADHTTGFRKDGETPAFHHPLAVARLVRTLPPLIHSEESLAAALLHDLLEDCPEVTQAQLTELFGKLVSDAVWALSKKTPNGLVKTPESYFTDLAKNPIGSIVKACDRVHNIFTMGKVFSPKKQLAYVTEVEELFLPMITRAGELHPEQFKAYENVALILRAQCGPVKNLCIVTIPKDES